MFTILKNSEQSVQLDVGEPQKPDTVVYRIMCGFAAFAATFVQQICCKYPLNWYAGMGICRQGTGFP